MNTGNNRSLKIKIIIKHLIPSLRTSQIYLKRACDNFMSIDVAVSENFALRTLKKVFREERFQTFGNQLH